MVDLREFAHDFGNLVICFENDHLHFCLNLKKANIHKEINKVHKTRHKWKKLTQPSYLEFVDVYRLILVKITSIIQRNGGVWRRCDSSNMTHRQFSAYLDFVYNIASVVVMSLIVLATEERLL